MDLELLEVSPEEVKAALADERRRGVRRRLVAIDTILSGKSIKQAARAARTSQRSVERWLARVRHAGFQSLLVDGRRGRARQKMKSSKAVHTRRQIAAAVARPLKLQVRARLLAIDAVLSGQPIDEVAASAGVLPNTVRKWVRIVSREGVDGAVDGWQLDRRLRPGRLDVDPAILHELATKEINPRVRKRIHALACIAEGMSTYDAAAKAGLDHWAITKRVRRFQKEGMAAFQDMKVAGRPYRLSPEQLLGLRHEVLQHPEISYPQLRDLVWTRFRVRYSRDSLRRLMKTKLGVAWLPARSRAADTRPEPGKKAARDHRSLKERQGAVAAGKNLRGRPRKLNGAQLEELREYVLKRPQVSFWRLYRLVWNRFRVRHSHASLKRLLKSEFGIAWRGASRKLGEGLNLAELQVALAGATDWRTKKRVKALIELAKGAEANAVARSHLMSLETLRKWSKRYLRSGIDGLRGGARATGNPADARIFR